MTGIFGLLLGPMGTFSIFRITSKPSRMRPALNFPIVSLFKPGGRVALLGLTEYYMLSVKELAPSTGNKELASIGVFAAVCLHEMMTSIISPGQHHVTTLRMQREEFYHGQ